MNVQNGAGWYIKTVFKPSVYGLLLSVKSYMWIPSPPNMCLSNDQTFANGTVALVQVHVF